MDHKIIVEHVQNGFIVSMTDDCKMTEKYIFEDPEDADQFNPHPGLKGMLNFFIDHFGCAGGRHDAARLRVVYEAGDKYEDSQELKLQVDPQIFDRT